MKPLLAFKSLAAAGLILAAATIPRPIPLNARQPEEPSRVLCEEVAHELNLAYIDGRISKEDAMGIIDRCFETFS